MSTCSRVEKNVERSGRRGGRGGEVDVDVDCTLWSTRKGQVLYFERDMG